MESQASNHQNNSSCTLLLYGEICVSCVGKVETRSKLDPALNEACRSITGCLKPTYVENVYLLAGIAPHGVRRATTSRQERRKQAEDPKHSLHSHEPVNKRQKSRNSFVHSVTPLDTNSPAERLRAWTHHLRFVPQKLISIPSENLCPGSEAPWLHWKFFNRLRTGMGRRKSNMLKWEYSDADIVCDSGEQTHTMDHLLKCPMLPQECTTDDLMEYNEAEKECVFQWMNNV